VLDASRGVTVANNLITDNQRETFLSDIRAEYEKVRADHQRKQESKTLLTLAQARANRLKIDWRKSDITPPKKLGVTALKNYPLEEIRQYIDWTPFFITWEMSAKPIRSGGKGRYPQILEDATVGEEARKLFRDANKLLDDIIAKKLLRANAVFGLFPANAIGDDIEVYVDESRQQVRTVFHTLRQQTEKTGGNLNLALADFIAPKDSGVKDYIGAFAVTAGIGVDDLVKKFEQQHDDYNAIMVKALADRLAEAFAELLHEKVRKQFWGYAADEKFSNDDLIKEKYRGIRPAPGYPACPDHTEKRLLFDLIGVEKNAGITLTENFAMLPAASVSGLYFACPDAKYFTVGKIAKDQLLDYQQRKGMSLAEVEKWLRPNT
jgi:5-methyltetrahydrofolate--homocysteine methyltransferase